MTRDLTRPIAHAVLIVLACSPGGQVHAAPLSDPEPRAAEPDVRININVAPVSELVTLPGIGPSRAEAIVEERKKRPFRRVEDVMRVPGVGRKTYLRIRDSIRVR